MIENERMFMNPDVFDVPPAVRLLVSEVASCEDFGAAKKRLRSLLRDLRQQSEVYQNINIEHRSTRSKPLEFDIYLHGGLNLFDPRGACSNFDCRIQSADRLARSIGLIADHIWITDLLTERFIDFGAVTDEKLHRAVSDALVLERLWPLIDAGVVRFRSPWVATCQGCLSNFELTVERIAHEIADEFAGEVKLKREPSGDYSVDTGTFFEPAVWVNRARRGPVPPSKKAVAAQLIYEQVRSALWVGREAALCGGSIFSNSRVGLAGLMQQEGRFASRSQLMALDNQRSLDVPWVSELNAAQILELRQEASAALPLFRERMARVLTINNGLERSETAAAQFMQELREQSVEVRAELAVAQKSSARFWKTTYALLGLGLSAYGVANDQILPGVGGLLPLISLLISHKAGHEKDLAKFKTKPSYVLVKAQDILGHAH
jgi:hypothetical protein